MKYAVDFDGTLADYDTWRGIEHTGAPIPGMVNRVRQWLAEGHEVFVITARLQASEEFGVEDRNEARARQVVEDWTEKHIGKRLRVTKVKAGFDELWDDKVVQVVKNTGLSLQEHIEAELWGLHRAALEERNTALMVRINGVIQKLRKLSGA